MWRNVIYAQPVYAPADDGGGGTPAEGGGGGAPAIPWANAEDGRWSIGDKPWYEAAIPETEADKPIRDFMKAKNYGNPAVLAKSLYEMNRQYEHAKSNSVALPAEGATAEDWNAFYKRLGRPDSVEGYNEVRWGENADPKLVEFGKNLAFKLGLNPKVTESVLANEWNEFAKALNTEAETQAAEDNKKLVETLKTEWQGDFDANLAAGKRVIEVLQKNGVTDVDLAQMEQHMGVPGVVKIMATIGKLTGEGNFMDGGGPNSDLDNMTPENAKAEIERNLGDEEFSKKYYNKDHPEHKNAVERHEKLYRIAAPLM